MSAALDSTTDTPRTDAHLSHLNLPDGRKVGIPDQTVALLRELERDLTVAKGLEQMAYDQRDKAFDQLNAMQSAGAVTKAHAQRLEDALSDVVSGWHDIDSRIRYVEVQIDKDEIKSIHRLLGKPEPEFK